MMITIITTICYFIMLYDRILRVHLPMCSKLFTMSSTLFIISDCVHEALLFCSWAENDGKIDRKKNMI